jgi:hypothetical protein
VTTTKPRLVTRIAPALDRRLRMAAAVSLKPITTVLEAALDKGLPTAAELADLIRGGEAPDDGPR